MTTTTKPEVTSQQADVTAVLANIDAGAALRDRIKELQKQLKTHEDLVKDTLGEAVEGVDSAGNIVVRYPHRNRSGLNKAKVKELLTPELYADCEEVTTYRTLLYGEG